MSEPATIDGTASDVPAPDSVDPDAQSSQALSTVAPSARLAVTPQVPAAELVARLDVIREASVSAMQEGIDFGRIPGVDKPTLLKPGAEKLGVLFQLDVQLENRKTWGPGDHLTVESTATVFHAPTGTRLGFGEGLCTTRERKYGKRKEQRVCPDCGKPAVIKGKPEYGGGWVCFRKKDGCGAKWTDGSEQGQAFETQEVGEVDNPDLPDTWNTVIKMAEKRARVDAILAVTGASALFTQDAEDLGAGGAAAGVADTLPAAVLPDWALPVDDDTYAGVVRAATVILGDPVVAARFAGAIVERCGHMPALAGQVLRPLAARVEENRSAGPDVPWDQGYASEAPGPDVSSDSSSPDQESLLP